jgi:methionine synthase II (cobalamin-independent)
MIIIDGTIGEYRYIMWRYCLLPEEPIMIKKTDFIEDLLEEYDGINGHLMKKGVVCIQCGEPVWGTLEDAIKAKGLDVNRIITELNEIYKS